MKEESGEGKRIFPKKKIVRESRKKNDEEFDVKGWWGKDLKDRRKKQPVDKTYQTFLKLMKKDEDERIKAEKTSQTYLFKQQKKDELKRIRKEEKEE